MLRYTLRRLLAAIVQLLAISVIVFFMLRILPANPVANLVGDFASKQAFANAKHSLGLDKPVLEQLGIFLGVLPGHKAGLLEGNLGRSFVTKATVASEIRRYLPNTLELLFYSFIVGLTVSIPVAIWSALKRGGVVDRGSHLYSLFAGAQPEFWWGLVAIYFFFFKWHLAPAPLGHLDPLTQTPHRITGLVSIDALIEGKWATWISAMEHLMLPCLVLGFLITGPIVKMVRNNMIAVLESDFVYYGRACGLSTRSLAFYIFRNAFAPSLNLIGIILGYLIGGAVLIEQVFSLGGIGQYAITSILNLDYPAIQGVVLTIAGLSLLIYLTIDLIHAWMDPRVRL